MAKTVDNPRGYFESTLIGPINNSLLNLTNSSWDKPPIGLIDWNQGKYLNIASNNRENFKEYALRNDWVDKDPRLSITAPLFQHLLLKRVPYSISVRNPIEVASSLYYRDGILMSKGLLLWFLYNRHCSEILDPKQDSLFSYEHLIAAEKNQMANLLEQSKRQWPNLFAEDNINACILEAHQHSTSLELRRNRAGANSTDLKLVESEPLLNHCTKLYAQLSTGGFNLGLYKELFHEIPGFIINDYHTILGHGEPSLEYIRNHHIKAIENSIQGISVECSTGSLEIDQTIISTYAELLESFHQLKQEIPVISELNNKLIGVEQLDQLKIELAEAISQKNEAMAALNNLKNSFTWKISSPIRKILDRLKLLLS